jgi:hypothetical protein
VLNKINLVTKAAGLIRLRESETLWQILVANRTSAAPAKTKNSICYGHMYEVIRGYARCRIILPRH